MNSPSLQGIFDGALEASFASYRVGMALRAAWPGLALVEGNSELFDLDGYAAAGRCELTPIAGAHAEVHTRWNAPKLDDERFPWERRWEPGPERRRAAGSVSRHSANAVYEVRVDAQTLRVAVASWAEAGCAKFHWWVLADDHAAAESFAVSVCRFGNESRDEVHVVNGEHWRRDRELHAAIRATALDELILDEGFRRELVEDFTGFLGARAQYAELRVPWKRGVLFVGPPGNGKTHCLRAVLNLLALPIVYVQSLRARYDTDERNMEQVFSRARRMAPCVLVFEDLDAQITDQNRSFFLNQLDGFEPNAELLVVATTNHAERLDPALVERPSRFDRKYHFGLPTAAEREAYLRRWIDGTKGPRPPTPEQLARLVAATEGFSFAYLKELCLAAAIRWMKTRAESGIQPLLQSQCEVLRAQMRTDGAAGATSAGAPRDTPVAELQRSVGRVLSSFRSGRR